MKKFKDIGFIVLLVFIGAWLFWYFSGGPQRSQNVKPYVIYDYNTGTINNSNANLGAGLQDMTGINAVKDATTTIKEVQNLSKNSSTTSDNVHNKQ